MTIKRLADLKRIPVGTRLRLVECLMGKVPEGRQGREVVKVQATSIAFRREQDDDAWALSWLTFPPARDFRATPDGFAIFEGDVCAARYVMVERECSHADCGATCGYGTCGDCPVCGSLSPWRCGCVVASEEGRP